MPLDKSHVTSTAFSCLPRNLVCSPPLLAYPFAVPHFCDLDCTLPLLTYPAPKYAFIYKTKVQLRESSEIKGTDHQAWRWSVPLICLGFLCLYPRFQVRKPWQSFRMAQWPQYDLDMQNQGTAKGIKRNQGYRPPGLGMVCTLDLLRFPLSVPLFCGAKALAILLEGL